MGTELSSQPAADRRLLDLRQHAPPSWTRSSRTSPTWRYRRALAADHARTAPLLETLAQHAARAARCSSATTSSGSCGLPRRRRRRLKPSRRAGPGADRRGRAPTRATRRRDARLARPCSGGSITSASRSRTSTRPSGSTASGSAWPSSTARPSRSRASRRCCSSVGESHVELLAAARRRTRRSGSSSSGTAPAFTTWRTGRTTSSPRSTRCAAPACALIDEEPRIGIRGSRVAFLHPKSTGGVLTELVEARGGPLMAETPRRMDIGFQGGQVLSVRVSQDGPRRRCARRCRTRAPERWFELQTPGLRGRTSTCRRSSTCGSTPKSTAWASSPCAARRARSPAAPPAPHARAHAGGRDRADQARAGRRERASCGTRSPSSAGRSARAAATTTCARSRSCS